MSYYNKINRFLLVICALFSCYFVAVHEYETALAVALLWLLSKASLTIADVFFTFFTERPLFAAEKPTGIETAQRNFSQR